MLKVEDLPAKTRSAAEEAEDAHNRACDMEPCIERSWLIGLSIALDGGSASHLAEVIVDEENEEHRKALVKGYAEGLTRNKLIG